jgi:hypothetical protein
MTTFKIIKNIKGGESKSLSSQTDVESTQLLGKKRYNLSKINKEMRKSLKIKRKQSSPCPKIDKKIELFLSNYYELIINMKKNDKIFSNYFSTQEKYYFNSILNLDLVKIIFSYINKISNFQKNNKKLNLNLFIQLTQIFLMNENDIAALTLLIEQYLFFHNANLYTDENLFYLGLYTKYITSNEFYYIFNEMLKINVSFKNWYTLNKNLLDIFDIDIQKVNQRYTLFKQSQKQVKFIDYNLMIKDIIDPISFKHNEKKQNTNSIVKSNSNIGKIIDVIIVYTEGPDNDNSRDGSQISNGIIDIKQQVN